MEVPNESSEKIYEELYTEASEGFGMSANLSYGGMASIRDEEEVHTYCAKALEWVRWPPVEWSHQGLRKNCPAMKQGGKMKDGLYNR
jgi:hypothetical protein